MRIGPPGSRCFIAATVGGPWSRGGFAQVSARSKRAVPATVRRMDEREAILVVEDDEAIASGLVRVLEGQGYAVRRLARGAGRGARRRSPASGLVVLDLGLPDVDGLDVCRRLRAARPDAGDPDPHRARPRARHRGRAGRRRRRLPRQAVSPLGAARPHPLASAAGSTVDARARRSRCRSGELRIDRSARRAWLGARGARAAAEGVRPADPVRGQRRRGADARADHGARSGRPPGWDRPRPSTPTSSACARSSEPTRSRPSAGSATASSSR